MSPKVSVLILERDEWVHCGKVVAGFVATMPKWIRMPDYEKCDYEMLSQPTPDLKLILF